MGIRTKIRELFYSTTVAFVVVLLGTIVAISATRSTSIRLTAAILGAGVAFAGAQISGNPRLFCLWGLGFSIPFLFAKTFGEALDKGGGEVVFNIDVTDLFMIVLLTYQAYDIFRGRRDGIRIPKASYFWIAIMALGFATIIGGPYRTTAAHEVFRMAKMLVLFLVLSQELETPKRILHWCGALILGLFVNALVGLFQYYYHTTLGLADLGEASDRVTQVLAATSVEGVEVWRVGAFLLHPNVFGAFLAALLPLTVACFFMQKGAVNKLYYFGAFVCGCGALIATQSRSGWISFAASLSAFLIASITHHGLRRRSMLAAAGLVLALLCVTAAAQGTIMTRLFQSSEYALSFRGVGRAEARRMIAEKPLWGWGLNTFTLELPPYSKYNYGTWPPPVHQIYYLWWAETGIIGLAIHLSMWAAIVWAGIRNLKIKDERLFAVNAACLAGMLAFALDGFASFSLRLTPTLKTFWVFAAMMMAIRYWRLRHEVYPQTLTAGPS